MSEKIDFSSRFFRRYDKIGIPDLCDRSKFNFCVIHFIQRL